MVLIILEVFTFLKSDFKAHIVVLKWDPWDLHTLPDQVFSL